MPFTLYVKIFYSFISLVSGDVEMVVQSFFLQNQWMHGAFLCKREKNM